MAGDRIGEVCLSEERIDPPVSPEKGTPMEWDWVDLGWIVE